MWVESCIISQSLFYKLLSLIVLGCRVLILEIIRSRAKAQGKGQITYGRFP